MCDGFFHHPCGLDHLGQKHLASTKQIPDHVHAIHKGSFNDMNGPIELMARFFCILHHKCINAFYHRMFKALIDWPTAPFNVFFLSACTVTLVFIRNFQQALCCIAAAVEHDVFNPFSQFSR